MPAAQQQREQDRIKHVIIVDDNESQLMTWAAILRDEGLKVTTSDNPQQALELIESGTFGVAIVDLKMPELSGIQVLESIKRLPRHMHVIIHTGHGDFDSARRAVNLGAFAFVEKMSDPDELISHIHRACANLLERYSDELEADVKQQSEALYLAESRAQTTLHSLAEGIIVTDSDSKITYMNPVAETLTGWQQEQAKDKVLERVFNIVDGNTHASIANPAARCLEVNRVISSSADTLLIGKDGNEYWIRGSAAPLKNPDGKTYGVVLTLNNVTSRVAAEHELRKYKDQLEDLVNERTAALRVSIKELESFSYSVSHDLRSPLRSIDGFSHLLLTDYAEQLDEHALDALQRVRAASQRMGKLIDDLLQLSRLTRRDLSRERVNLTSLAHDISRGLIETASNRTFKFEINDDLHASGDTALLRIALENLLGNAVKYTQHEAVAEIRLREVTRNIPTKNSERIFCIDDNGVGFEMAYADKLFGAFQRLHGTEFEGSGIGLATAARIIERHGGRVWAEGEVNIGAKFYFALPE